MKLEQFAHVIEVAETGSFSQAARNLYISQPNLSYSVAQIERELGFPIFERTSGGVIPTAEGREAITHFKIIHQEYIHLRRAYSQQPPAPRLALRVATLNTNRIAMVLPSVIQRYADRPIRFSFHNYTHLDTLVGKVATCQVDFALMGILSPYIKSTRAMLANRHIEYHALSTVPVSVVVGPDNPLYSGADSVSMEGIYDSTIISYGDSTEDPTYCLSTVSGIEKRARGHIHVNSSQLFYQTIQQTPVVGLIASTGETFRVYNSWPDIRILELADCPIQVELAWIKLRRMPLSDVAAELLEACKSLF